MVYSVIPIIYVKNNTDEEIKDLYFTIEGYIKKDPVIKSIPPGTQKVVTILNTWYRGEKELKMYTLDESSDKKEYLLRNNLSGNTMSLEVKVRIDSINEANDLDLVIDEGLSNLYRGEFV